MKPLNLLMKVLAVAVLMLASTSVQPAQATTGCKVAPNPACDMCSFGDCECVICGDMGCCWCGESGGEILDFGNAC